MHEMSIALSIIEIVNDHISDTKDPKVKEVELEIGTMAGIEFESLNFALESATKNSILEETFFKINKIQSESKCLDCEHIFHSTNLFDKCPACKSHSSLLIKGKELKVKSILID